MFAVLWRFRSTLRPYRGRLLGGCLLVLVGALLELALPWPLKLVVDHALRDEPLTGPIGDAVTWLTSGSTTSLLVLSALLLAGVAALRAGVGYLAEKRLESVGERVLSDLRTSTFAHLQRLSMGYHERQKVGDLSERLTSDITTMQALFVAAVSTLVPNVVLLVGIVTITFFIDPLFAGLAMVIAPLLFGTVLYYRRRIKAAAKDARKQDGRVASHATETLSSIRLVQTYSAEGRADERLAGFSADRLDAGLRRVDYAARLPAWIDVIAQGGRALVLFVGAWRVLSGDLTLGVLLVFLAYLQQLYSPMKQLAKLTTTISKGVASADRVVEVLLAGAVVTDRPGATQAPSLRGDLELRGVSFGYAPGNRVLHGIDLSARAGQTIALAGPTGAGKSTILSLIPRLYDPQSGTVAMDGRDVRTWTLASLRAQIAMVLQDPVILAGTILDNIAFGAPHLDRDALIHAAEAAHVDEFVGKLPDGYDTVVAERGTTLSGGQRQRIAIARALARDARIVLLDEPTSGLDAVSERLVMDGLERLTDGRTVVVVAHRLATLRNADRIDVVVGGWLAECGTHDDLVDGDGPYARMHRAMAGTPEAVAEPPVVPPLELVPALTRA